MKTISCDCCTKILDAKGEEIIHLDSYDPDGNILRKYDYCSRCWNRMMVVVRKGLKKFEDSKWYKACKE